MPSQKQDISKNILQDVLWKHIHVTSLTDNIQTDIKVMINTKWEQLAVELNWFIFLSVQVMSVKTILIHEKNIICAINYFYSNCDAM